MYILGPCFRALSLVDYLRVSRLPLEGFLRGKPWAEVEELEVATFMLLILEQHKKFGHLRLL